MTVVVPWQHQPRELAGRRCDDSMCTWASMRPGTTQMPVASIVSAAVVAGAQTAIQPSAIASRP